MGKFKRRVDEVTAYQFKGEFIPEVNRPQYISKEDKKGYIKLGDIDRYVHDGDWIVINGSDEYIIMGDYDFKKRYVEIEEEKLFFNNIRNAYRILFGGCKCK